MSSMTNHACENGRRYDNDVDFEQLAREDAEFATFYDAENGRLDFRDSKALQQLTKSLLKRDFGILLELPNDRLCPPVPVRYNYVAWIQSLLDTTNSTLADNYESSRKVVGLDIGTGASAIYALLACSIRPKWHMFATELDTHSWTYAEQNISRNPDIAKRIKLHKTETDSPLIPLDTLRLDRLDFVMCNPPFYSSAEEMAQSAESKARAADAVCTGATTEMICPGGDSGFVLRMVDESLMLCGKVQWYTSMLGKLSSVHVVIARLRAEGVSNFAVTNLHAGKKTRRWAIGWSFKDYRPRNDVARGGELVQSVLPFPTAQTISLEGLESEEAAEFINGLINGLDLQWRFEHDTSIGLALATENVWSRAARRKRKRVEHDEDDRQPREDVKTKGDKNDTEDIMIALAVRIVIKETSLDLRWLRGLDSTIFESFGGMLKRAIRERARSKG